MKITFNTDTKWNKVWVMLANVNPFFLYSRYGDDKLSALRSAKKDLTQKKSTINMALREICSEIEKEENK